MKVCTLRNNERSILAYMPLIFTALALFIQFTISPIAGNKEAFASSSMLESRGIGNEDRIKIINYSPNRVIKFIGHFMYHSIIEFAAEENIVNISLGTPGSWQINPNQNRIFIKPTSEDYTTTNMTVITNKRIYFFELHATHAENISDKNIAFITKFIYPSFVKDGNESSTGAVVSISDSIPSPDLSKPHLYNFDYVLSGDDRNIEPMLVFDDGEFTYMKFRDINAELPAIFTVSKTGREALINYRVFKGYVVVEMVTSQFSLKKGKESICIFNKSFGNDL